MYVIIDLYKVNKKIFPKSLSVCNYRKGIAYVLPPLRYRDWKFIKLMDKLRDKGTPE